MIRIEGIEELNKLCDKVDRYNKEIENMIGKNHDTSITGFFPTPKLHQDSEDMSAEDSALFEKNNPGVFYFLEALKHKLTRIFKEN